MMELIAKSFVAIALISLLIFIDPKIAFIAGFVISISYGLIYKYSRNYINRIGQERVKVNQMRYTAVSEAFGAAKVKVGGQKNILLNKLENQHKPILDMYLLRQL